MVQNILTSELNFQKFCQFPVKFDIAKGIYRQRIFILNAFSGKKNRKSEIYCIEGDRACTKLRIEMFVKPHQVDCEQRQPALDQCHCATLSTRVDHGNYLNFSKGIG